MIYINNHLF